MFSLADILQISVIFRRVGFLLLLLFLGSSSGIFLSKRVKFPAGFSRYI